MAKLYAVYQNEDLTNRETIEKKILAALKCVDPSCEQIPQGIQNFLDDQQFFPRIGVVRLMTYEQILNVPGKFYGKKSEVETFACTVKNDGHKLPLMLLYDPEWSVYATRKVERIRAYLMHYAHLELSDELIDIIRDELPDIMPERIHFEGSRSRFDALSQKEGSTTYKNVVVAHTMRSNNKEYPVWTFFIKEIDEVKHFARVLERQMCIEPELALRISNSWNHSSYISVNPRVWHNAKKYAACMALFACLEDGDTINDLLQGEIEIKERVDPYLNIDVNQASAVIIKGRLNVYVPYKKK